MSDLVFTFYYSCTIKQFMQIRGLDCQLRINSVILNKHWHFVITVKHKLVLCAGISSDDSAKELTRLPCYAKV